MTQITDAGLRSVGTNCHALVTIDVSHAKNVTDVGISSLSLGCPNLRHVKFHGVFMLSDPRLSAPKKGAKLEAWQAVIGVAALAEHCSFIETLDLSGCFRLNIALHQYVSTFHHLTVLNLAGCNQTNPEALSAVAKGCPLLVELNLSDCGKALNNKSVQAFAVHCKSLRVLALCRCTHISGGAMKAISSFSKLEKLDLTGCKTLTDTMLVYFTEGDKLPLLRTLSLVDVPAVTDSLLTWLSIKTQIILCLAVKGTAITVKGVKSVRDRFPNSDMLQNANFFGFWPKLRVDDRILINKYHNFIDGITRIQSRIRKHRAALRVQFIHLEWKRVAAQMLLQKLMRGFLARARTHLLRKNERKRQHSAIVVTTIFRIAIALKKVKRRRQYLRNQMKNDKAMMIQLCWRKHRDLGRLYAKRAAYRALLARREFGALKLQTAAYIFFARNRVRRIKALKRTREEVANRKATMIQRLYRGAVARRITERYREIFKTLASRRLAAALRIQRKVRVTRTNNIVNAAIYVKLHRLESVIRIQSLLRGALSRIHVAEMRTELNELNRVKAAIKIQTRLRMLKAMLVLQTRLQARDSLRRRQYLASQKIVGQARIKLACIRYREKRREYRRKMKETAQRELDAICKIQARVRGIKGRQLFEAKMRVRKGKWKELFDEKAKKRFFYNKLSGEIRWRMPQDLLDLIPHPHCDNCHHKDATLECSVCNELFCGPCFDSVHAGGRRKEHAFRALYDYYNKRLDYGDGEFPCKWPTEVMQDEVQGWMLRVAPQRAPVRKYQSGWEQYEEGPIVPSKKIGVSTPLGNGGKHFFFNRTTFEATYELPAEVDQEIQAEEQAAIEAQQQQVAMFAESSDYFDSSGGAWGDSQYYDPLAWTGAPETALGYDSTFPEGYVEGYSDEFAPADSGYYPPAITAEGEYDATYYPAQRPVLSGTSAGYNYANTYPVEEKHNSQQYYQSDKDEPNNIEYDRYNQQADGYETPQKQLEYDENYYDYEAPPPAAGTEVRELEPGVSQDEAVAVEDSWLDGMSSDDSSIASDEDADV